MAGYADEWHKLPNGLVSVVFTRYAFTSPLLCTYLWTSDVRTDNDISAMVDADCVIFDETRILRMDSYRESYKLTSFSFYFVSSSYSVYRLIRSHPAYIVLTAFPIYRSCYSAIYRSERVRNLFSSNQILNPLYSSLCAYVFQRPCF